MNISLINEYIIYSKRPNTIDKDARIYTKTFYFDTYNDFKNRLIRVYLPSTYDFKNPRKRFPVLYMFDGKNLFDDYTSFVGEWGVDETIENSIRTATSKGIIVVGIDAPNTDIDRTLEMSPEDIKTKAKYYKGEGYLNILSNFVINVVKKDIDNTFFTKKDKNNTFVGGSSMGGLAAFYFGTHHYNVFSSALCFSPAFFLLNKKELNDYLKIIVKHELPKMYFYVGGVGFESLFIKDTLDTYNYLKQNNKYAEIILDSSKEHNEKAWKEYFVKFFAMLNV